MRKGFLGIILVLSLILVAGCSGMKSQEVSAHLGISIARRGASRITPVPVDGQSVDQSVEPTLDASMESIQPPIVETAAVANPSLTPVEPTLTTPPPTSAPVLTQSLIPNPSSGVDSTDQSTTCAPDINRSFESEVIQLINQERGKEGLAPLSEQSQLTQAARLHSQDMACNQFFSHLSPENGDVADRVTAQGYQYSAIGENIAGGYSSPASVVEGWMNSTGHRANIMSGTYTQVGVGYVYLAGSKLGTYWTLLVGTP
jgi:uncharacterized protein YkwD